MEDDGYNDAGDSDAGLKIKNPNFNPAPLGGKTSGPLSGLGNPNFGKSDRLGGKVSGPLSGLSNPNNSGS